MTYDWKDAPKNQYIKLKEGDTITFTVKSISQEPNKDPKYNLSGKDYYLKVTTDKGVLSVATWGLYFACQGVQLREDKTYSVKYIKQGKPGKVSQYEIIELPTTNPDEVFKGTTEDDFEPVP